MPGEQYPGEHLGADPPPGWRTTPACDASGDRIRVMTRAEADARQAERVKAVEWAEKCAEDYGNEHAALVDYLFAPPESYDDAWLERLLDVAEFVERQPCRCTGDDEVPEYDESQCERCYVLNRYHDKPLGAGR